MVDATPYGKDVLGPLAAKCKKQGITFCLYYSIMDWHHPSQKVVEKGQHPDSGYGPDRHAARTKAGIHQLYESPAQGTRDQI